MDLNLIKDAVEVKVYNIGVDTKVPLHKHNDKDEVFYCIKGSGFGLSDTHQEELNIGQTFIARAGTMHSLKSNDEMIVVAVLVPTA